MMRFRSLILLAMCALASACASTGQHAAGTTPSAPIVITDDSVAVDSAATSAVENASVETTTADVHDIAPATPAQASGNEDAEEDFAAIYGQPGDGNTPATGAAATAAFDPWEKYNRRMHTFNMAVDRGLAKPLARAYVAAVPQPMRTGVSNFFDNLGQPITVVNSLLQGNPRGASNALGRFLLNSTVGIGGLFDLATKAKMPKQGEDFGQTLAVWGWQRSRYLELPMLGPRTLRDLIGMAGDAPLRPLQYLEDDKTRVFLQGLQLVDMRAKLLPIEGLMEQGVVDEYALFRDMWLQRRNYQINQVGKDRDGSKSDETLPSYLLEDDESAPEIPGN